MRSPAAASTTAGASPSGRTESSTSPPAPPTWTPPPRTSPPWPARSCASTPTAPFPADNPFAGSPVYSLGHRNPQGLAWHPATGALWSTEHGPTGTPPFCCHDEINVIAPGGNYGWPRYYGSLVNTTHAGLTVADPVFPVWESGSGKWAPGGGDLLHRRPARRPLGRQPPVRGPRLPERRRPRALPPRPGRRRRHADRPRQRSGEPVRAPARRGAGPRRRASTSPPATATVAASRSPTTTASCACRRPSTRRARTPRSPSTTTPARAPPPTGPA